MKYLLSKKGFIKCVKGDCRKKYKIGIITGGNSKTGRQYSEYLEDIAYAYYKSIEEGKE